jgi:hypothetical protein
MKRPLISMLIGLLCGACATPFTQTFNKPAAAPAHVVAPPTDTYIAYPYNQPAAPQTDTPTAGPVVSPIPVPQAPTPTAPLPAAPTTNAPTPQSPTASPQAQQQSTQAAQPQVVQPTAKPQPAQSSEHQTQPIVTVQKQPAPQPAPSQTPNQPASKAVSPQSHPSKASQSVTVDIKQLDSKTIEELRKMFPQQQPSN